MIVVVENDRLLFIYYVSGFVRSFFCVISFNYYVITMDIVFIIY